MHTTPAPAAPARRPGSPGAAAEPYPPQAELEQLRHWPEASAVVREACRIRAEVEILPPLLTFFTLILALLMSLKVAKPMVASFRRMLADLTFDADGNLVAMNGASAPLCTAGPRSGTQAWRSPALAGRALDTGAIPLASQPRGRRPRFAPFAAHRPAGAARDGPPRLQASGPPLLGSPQPPAHHKSSRSVAA
jgi:hypothetical protein